MCMSYTVSITSQGQISIPAPLRHKLGLHKSNKALVTEKDGKVIIEPIKDLLELKGSLKTNKVFSPKQVRQSFEEYLGNRSKNQV